MFLTLSYVSVFKDVLANDIMMIRDTKWVCYWQAYVNNVLLRQWLLPYKCLTILFWVLPVVKVHACVHFMLILKLVKIQTVNHLALGKQILRWVLSHLLLTLYCSCHSEVMGNEDLLILFLNSKVCNFNICWCSCLFGDCCLSAC